ncbi:MAG: hypothetical protein V9E94_18550, partial [Microthrixaceae bacterium]
MRADATSRVNTECTLPVPMAFDSVARASAWARMVRDQPGGERADDDDGDRQGQQHLDQGHAALIAGPAGVGVRAFSRLRLRPLLLGDHHRGGPWRPARPLDANRQPLAALVSAARAGGAE